MASRLCRAAPAGSGDAIVSFEDVTGGGALELRESADVVVVGSGAGGGAVAAELAEAGRSVILIEEGGYYSERDFTSDAPAMIKKLYRNAGTAVIRGRPKDRKSVV